MSTGEAVLFVIFAIGVMLFITWCMCKSDKEEYKSTTDGCSYKHKTEEIQQKPNKQQFNSDAKELLEQQKQLQLKHEESFEIAVINRIKRFIKNNTDLFNSLKYIFDSAKNLYENNLWCWDSLTLSYGPSIELIYSVETNKFYIGYSYGSWSAYIDSCFSENNLNFFSKTREFKSGYGFKTTIKNNLNYHTLYSMLKDLKENIEYILYNFKSYTED